MYVVLSTPWAQERLRQIGQDELSRLLGTEVTIEGVDFSPLDRIVLEGVAVKDDYRERALYVGELSLRFELNYFLSERRIVFDYATIDRMDAHLYKKSADAPLNISRIIKNLQPKDKTKPPTKFELAIATVEISNSSFRYDILDAPRRASGLDTKHIALSQLNVSAGLPRVTHEGAVIDLAHLSFSEKSGLRLDDFTAQVSVLPHNVSLKNPVIVMPHSRIALNSFEFAPANLGELKGRGTTTAVDVSIEPGSFVTPSDLAWALPALSRMNRRFDISLDAGGTLNALTMRKLHISEHSGGRLLIDASGRVSGLPKPDSVYVDGLNLNLRARASDISEIAGLVANKLPPRAVQIINSLGDIKLNAQVSGDMRTLDGALDLASSLGTLQFDGTAHIDPRSKSGSMDARISVGNFDLGTLAANPNLGRLTADIEAAGSKRGNEYQAEGSLKVSSLAYRGAEYGNLTLEGAWRPDRTFDAVLDMDNALGKVTLDASGSMAHGHGALVLSSAIANLDLSALGLKGQYAGYRLGANIETELSGSLSDWVNGYIRADDISFSAPVADKPSLHINNIALNADNSSRPATVTLASDFINGSLEGQICLRTLPGDILKAIGTVLPAFVDSNSPLAKSDCHEHVNRFTYEFTIDNAETLGRFFRLPVKIIYPINIDGSADMGQGKMLLSVDAPYLLNGDKIIENTALQAELDASDSESGTATLYATTQMPTKKGPMALVTTMNAARNRIDTQVNWMLEREKPINGILAFSTLLSRDNGVFNADVSFNPCDINFGTDTWHIAPSTISYRPGRLSISDFVMTTGKQRIAIDGTGSASADDVLNVDLHKINLISIFETLDINNALIGGSATGRVHGSALFSPEPRLTTDGIHVDSISYNYCVLGTADVRAHWDNTAKAVMLDADVLNQQHQHSRIYGSITPAREELDINIDARHVRTGFLKTFMAAFADDVSGHASGHAHLYGTFKNIDLTGDLAAENFGLKVGFTNTWFYCTDSVHIQPGKILIDNAEVRDALGHTARLSGYVTHHFFHDPTFDFKLTDAHDFLSYDVTPRQSPDWYGRIYGNGSAFINGHPGVVNINVNMSTAPESSFTFVLSDREEADEYTFISFRDRNVQTVTDTLIQADRIPAIVREHQRRAQKTADTPTEYNMDIQVDITPQAAINVVMDPIGGDMIKSNGKGSLRMTYRSAGNDLRMYGTYTIEHGSYNFTLQDIIVKDFRIREGSSIAFTGDPYSARLDIQALYSVNANLSDLDESFLQDKDLNRTNVPVNALLNVKGDMRQPEISFDLEFPTLTSDTYRKVRSIVSTDEMMNRQIIYLLALGRFYTPDYMSTTKGNELFSVASSTIGSQLSSMLGKLSDKWTIAPNLRSDKGDFSDVEFDLALSSSLLNNRLRMNGNFGYRDKSLNTNQFIGDFDIEYLLNRSGSWRLKAYNRFNDQNYYLRTAQTTQGVGIMYRRDFDRLFNFLRPKRRDDTDSIPSQPTTPADSATVSAGAAPANTDTKQPDDH